MTRESCSWGWSSWMRRDATDLWGAPSFLRMQRPFASMARSKAAWSTAAESSPGARGAAAWSWRSRCDSICRWSRLLRVRTARRDARAVKRSSGSVAASVSIPRARSLYKEKRGEERCTNVVCEHQLCYLSAC